MKDRILLTQLTVPSARWHTGGPIELLHPSIQPASHPPPNPPHPSIHLSIQHTLCPWGQTRVQAYQKESNRASVSREPQANCPGTEQGRQGPKAPASTSIYSSQRDKGEGNLVTQGVTRAAPLPTIQEAKQKDPWRSFRTSPPTGQKESREVKR